MKLASAFAQSQLAHKSHLQLTPISTLGLTDPDPQFQSLVLQINQFNIRLKQNQPTELHEYSTYKQLAQVLADLANCKESKGETLLKTEEWLKEHQKMVEYEREVKKLFKEKPKTKGMEKMGNRTIEIGEVRREGTGRKGLVSDDRAEELLPFKMGNRTMISGLEPATERIKLYSRKQIIVMNDLKEQPPPIKPSRIVYKVDPFWRKANEQQYQDQQTPEPWKSEAPAEQIQGSPSPQLGNNEPAAQPVPQEIQQAAVQQEQEEQQQQDRLAPKNKLYTKAQKQGEKLISSNEASPFKKHIQSNIPAVKRMNHRYVRLINRQYKDKAQQDQQVNKFKQWAKEKARAGKQLARRGEIRLSKSNYLSPKNKKKPNNEPLSLSKQKVAQCSVILPQVSTSPERPSNLQFQNSIIEKLLNKEKRKALNRIKLQELEQVQQQPPSRSVVLAQQRKYKSLGAILDQYSPEKQQRKQQQQVLAIKERFAKYGFNAVTMKGLSQALVIPIVQENPQAPLPGVQLLHNPYFKVPKPKKKKKKK